MGGPDTQANRVWLCPTAHTNAHEILRAMMKFGRLTYGEVAASQEPPVNRYAYQVALRGYNAWKSVHDVQTGVS
jgi:hypothetical protein